MRLIGRVLEQTSHDRGHKRKYMMTVRDLDTAKIMFCYEWRDKREDIIDYTEKDKVFFLCKGFIEKEKLYLVEMKKYEEKEVVNVEKREVRG